MTPELGLVCVSASKTVRFKTMTRKRFLQFELAEQEQVLRELYTENLHRLAIAIKFCAEHHIRLYRLSSGLFPFADEPIGSAILDEFAEGLSLVGDQSRQLGIRLVFHPDQFVVLNSDRPEVIENSIKILTMHAHVFDLLGLPKSPWALINIHGGKGDRIERLLDTIANLPDNIRLRLTLENDEYTYSAEQMVSICSAAKIPHVFDAHHHVIYAQVDSYEHESVGAMLEAARSTWEVPEWQLVHISNGAESFLDQRHSDYITVMPSSYRQAPWIEIEAKQKELAIQKLQQEWLYSDLNVLSPVEAEPSPSKVASVSRAAQKVSLRK
ncbi:MULTISPECIES: UV DNA damage repair endonuclease UvsE [Leptolyngbya]|uniref:UV DNA damage repair endonuclease UvsE n=1 Tax=Leptolyngbya boryana CZ1 TaxID=3060204 RepID=A0AA97AMG3_LEPBY|nr:MULTISPECIES: UV DNA damage repair endonuclease UvsE [Leptolyngbya]MBD1854869.1 UV DNA damage repair endonuclease UvsE [Leptolyngbya sp. FACHB-1624]MCY6494054.1 UV DNA damage repair endonuclease UvsE [Leptolyngbya sp. GGD]WNZ44182.1 UV DNA damage repair endonuclease UvsE [Leptolyngbya boryana CZ1]